MNKPYEQSLKGSNLPPSAMTERLKSLCAYEIGVIPLPIFIGIACIVFLSAHLGFLPKNMIGGLAIIMTMGVFLGQLGQRMPILKEIGGGAILCLMLPSVLVFFGFFGAPTIDATKMLMKEANFLYFVIASLVVGSILGMSRFILVQGMIRMFVPLVAGTLAALAAGLLVGELFGYSVHHTFFYIIVPILGGGIGEGILPLSLAYSAILGGSPEQYVAQLVPAAVVGNIIAIICSGVLARIAIKRPNLNGQGTLIRAKNENVVVN
ncbi:2-hydroxycarboxylate transporter family protein, partial [Pseudomonas syringae group genomosp. 3]|uniref:2-hydroxycarboxylate transporter family protein n=1 Tax=Pseudomonas syringae group genomosp. 3 TaxID=251701 RepID=UPI000AC4FB04